MSDCKVNLSAILKLFEIYSDDKTPMEMKIICKKVMDTAKITDDEARIIGEYILERDL